MVFGAGTYHAVTVYSLVCLCCGVHVVQAASKKSHYEHSRHLASINHVSSLPDQSLISTANRLFHHRFQQSPFSYYEVPRKLIDSETLMQFDNDSCPNYHEISTSGAVKICPMYQVIEQDVNRIPQLLTQVKCRCLHCQGPWNERFVKRCTPLFDFPYVIRVVGVRNGHKQYALVREPQSFTCVCLRRHAKPRYVMAP